MPIDNQGSKVFHRKGTSALIINSFNGSLFANISDTIYALQVIPQRYETSKSFDVIPLSHVVRKVYIPPLEHPWKKESFLKFLDKQKNRKNSFDYTFDILN